MAKSTFISAVLKRNGKPLKHEKHLSAESVQKYAGEIEEYLRKCGFKPNPRIVGKFATMDQVQRIKEEEQQEREIDRLARAVSGAGQSSKGKKPKQSSSRSRPKRKATGNKSISAGFDELNK